MSEITTISMAGFSGKLRAARQLRGLTLKQVQAKTGISYVAIHQYELGKVVPGIDNAKKLADAYQLSLSDLFESFNISKH